MKSKIYLSIIVPNYNSKDYLSECLSCFNGYYDSGIEVIVIDDGSSDNSINLVRNERVRIIKNDENRGVSYSRNRGIDEARGKYILFVDADDKLRVGAIEELLESAKSNNDIIYFSKDRLSDNKKTLIRQILGTNKDGICIAGPFSKLYKKDFIKANNIKFKEDLINGEDMIFNIEAITKAKSHTVKHKNIYLYRKNNGSATRSFNKSIFQNDEIFHEYLKHILSPEYEDDISLLAINGLFIVISRISYLQTKEAVIKYKQIDTEFYKQFKDYTQSLDAFRRTTIRLYFKGHYKVLHYILKARRWISSTIKNNKEFTEI